MRTRDWPDGLPSQEANTSETLQPLALFLESRKTATHGVSEGYGENEEEL